MRVRLLDSHVSLRLPGWLARDLRALVAEDDTGQSPTVTITVGTRRGGFFVEGDGQTRFARDHASVLAAVLELLNRVAIGQCEDVAVHAGAVARDGQVLAFPGESGAGKTTLAAVLVKRGWDYVSDEALVLDREARVRAYPKWLSLHTWSLARLRLDPPAPGQAERPVGLAELGGAVAAGELRLAHVVLARREAGRSTLAAVDRAVVAAELLRSSFNHYKDPAAALSVIGRAMEGASAFRLSLDDPFEAAEVLSKAV